MVLPNGAPNYHETIAHSCGLPPDFYFFGWDQLEEQSWNMGLIDYFERMSYETQFMKIPRYGNTKTSEIKALIRGE